MDIMAGQRDEFLTCAICTDAFTNPKALPCLHTFCEDCIRDYAESRRNSNQQIVCPVCRAETTIPAGGVAAFPSNFHVTNFQEALSHQQTGPIYPSLPTPPQRTVPSRRPAEPSAPPVQRSLHVSPTDHPVPVNTNIKQAALVFGKYGKGLTDFEHPVGLTNLEDRFVIISDQRGNRIMQFDLEGRIQLMFTCKGLVHALCTDSKAQILVANSRAERALAKCYNTRGHSKGSYGNQFTHEKPHGIAASKNHVAISSLATNKVFLLDNTGRLIREIGGTGSRKQQLRQPLYMAFNTGEDLIVSDCDNNAVKVFSSRSTAPKFVIGGSEGCSENKFRRPLGVTTDMRGHIYVCDSGNHRVQCFDQSGKFVATVVSDIYGVSSGDDAVPRDIAMFGTSTLAVLVTGLSFNEVRIYQHQAQNQECICM